MSDILCDLHDDGERPHWIDARDLVGVIPMRNGVLQAGGDLIPASRVCAAHNGVAADRVVEWVAA